MEVVKLGREETPQNFIVFNWWRIEIFGVHFPDYAKKTKVDYLHLTQRFIY